MIGINNPFNIRYNPLNKWKGLTGVTRGFCNFSSVEYCVRAVGILILRTYKKHGVYTVSEIINRYAPPKENDTSKYVEFVCDKLSFFPFDKPSNVYEYAALFEAMSIFEGNTVRRSVIINVLRKYFKYEDF